MKILIVLNLFTLVLAVSSFGGSEDKFLKKYAMMKIYESCFGPEVVKQIRKEMKAACAKCAVYEMPTSLPPQQPTQPPQKPEEPQQPDASLFAQPQPSFDVEKLNQAILAYRPNAQPSSFYRPSYPSSAGLAPFYNPPYMSASAYQSPMFYPTGFPQQGQFSPYGGFPYLGSPYFGAGGNRVSRDMDIRAQLDSLTSRMSGRVRNVTCVMQELGYLDDNLEPNFQKITERIGNLPVSEELRRDMQDGVSFCQQFSQCVPDVKKDRSPLSRELIRPMFFFKCYKHKKLEACIMKDVREKYAGVTDEEFDNEMELKRMGKSAKLPSADGEVEQLASSMYDFLYGDGGSVDIDGLL